MPALEGGKKGDGSVRASARNEVMGKKERRGRRGESNRELSSHSVLFHLRTFAVFAGRSAGAEPSTPRHPTEAPQVANKRISCGRVICRTKATGNRAAHVLYPTDRSVS